MGKLSNKYLLTLSAVRVYQLLLDGKIVRFPNKFWVGEGAFRRAAEITIYLINNVLVWGEDDIKTKMGIRVFQDNKLFGMINSLFEGSPYKTIENAYPGKYRPWDFACVPRSFWTDESVEEVSQWIADNGVDKSSQTTKKLFRLSQSSMSKKGKKRRKNYG
ncbi:MAG TPA: hypothetical protein VIM51_10340 [Desulfosporosinus sp.]